MFSLNESHSGPYRLFYIIQQRPKPSLHEMFNNTAKYPPTMGNSGGT